MNNTFDFKTQMIEARRNQILRGAAEVFAKKGFQKGTIKEIARAAGISEGTIYNYFNNKDELLIAIVELFAVQSLHSLVTDLPAEDPHKFFAMLMENRYNLIQERGYLLVPILAEILADATLRQEVYNKIAKPVTERLEQYLKTESDIGVFRQLDPVIVVRAFIGAMFLNFALKVSNLDPRYEDIPVERLIEQTVSLFLHGLCQPGNNSDPKGYPEPTNAKPELSF
jgi:AcrR family transcriptional regulator